MGKQRPVPLTYTTAEGDISGSEDLINLIPRKSTGGKYPFTLIGSPGKAFFLNLPTFPVLQTIETDGRAFAVTSTKFYEVFKDGTYTELGDVDLQGIRVVMADNGIQVVAVDGIKGFYYDDNTGDVKELTGDGWYPAATVTYQDGYFLFDRAGTEQFFVSDLLSITFDPLDFASAEGQPDKLVAVLSDHREIFMFGTKTIEVWYNSGAADFPFERNQGAFIEKGCAARYTISKQDNTVYFVGSDLMVYQMQGYTPIRISSHAVEKTIKNVDLSDAFSYTYQEEGQLFYVLTIPANNITWTYDLSTQSWSKRKSHQFGRDISNNAMFFDGKTLTGDFQNGRIYQMTNEWFLDDEDPLVREFILPTISFGRERFSIDSFELDMSTGVGIPNTQGSDPQAWMAFSKDGGQTWSSWKFADIGKVGKYLTRVKWNRLGTGRQFDIKIRISDPIPIDIGGAYIEAS